MITPKSCLFLSLLLCGFVHLQVSAQVGDKGIPLFFEKAYLHTDRDVYAMGDTLWYKAYLVNAQDNKPSLSSGNLYVELIAPDSAKIVMREMIRMENGLGHGDMALADSLPAGHYILRAYTNWMRNFGDNFVFEKEITLLDIAANPGSSGSSSKQLLVTSNNKKDKRATAIATATQNKPPTNILPVVRFYPEGGSLVNGISSFVGVKAEDGYGKGIPATGAVLAASGDTVAHFSCDSLGLGLLALLPVSGQSYQAVVVLGTRHDVFPLPAALSKGLALQVRAADTVLHAIVHAAGTGSDSTVLMVLKHTGKTILSQQFQLKQHQLAFKISTAELPEGIAAITIYNQENKPECERLVYVHHSNNQSTISLITNKKSYQPKEQVTVNIQTQPNSSLSMAVVDAGTVPVQQENMVSYLNLQSEIKGNIENPNRYFDTTNINRTKQLDLLLMTQGWRDFVWRRMADTAIRISYAAENGISVPGRIRDENLNKLLPNLNITLYAPEAKGSKMFTARSDSMGRFHFNGLMLYGKQNVTLSAVNDKGQSKGAFWVDTLLPMPVQKRNLNLYTAMPEKAITSAIEKRNVELKRLNLYKTTVLKEVTIKAKTMPGGLSTHDKKLVRLDNGEQYLTWGPLQTFDIAPKDYWTKTLTWYIIQNVKGTMMARPPSPGVVVMPAGLPLYPILVVNGRTFHIDYNLYYNMPIEKFKKIEIQCVILPASVSLQYILFLTTKEDALIDNPGSIDTEIEGYYQARNFYEPLPGVKLSLTDYRTTIHWEPNIKTDATGKATVSFYNAVPQTDVRIVVQGITNSGIPLATTVRYEVK